MLAGKGAALGGGLPDHPRLLIPRTPPLVQSRPLLQLLFAGKGVSVRSILLILRPRLLILYSPPLVSSSSVCRCLQVKKLILKEISLSPPACSTSAPAAQLIPHLLLLAGQGTEPGGGN